MQRTRTSRAADAERSTYTMKIRALAFDLYGTLIEDFPVNRHRMLLVEIAGILGIDPEQYIEKWQSCYIDQENGMWRATSDCIRVIAESTGSEVASASLALATSHLHAFTRSTFLIRDGTASCLNQLKTLGYSIAIPI